MHIRRATLLLGLAAPLAAAGAQTPPSCDHPSQVPTILVVEGGGSLGIYEAGMTYVLVEVFKRKWLGVEIRPVFASLPALCLTVATGASAGSINSFLASTAWCDSSLSRVPEESMFWRAWITTGLMQLMHPLSKNAEQALFSRRHLDGYLSDRLRDRWGRARWADGCRVQFGATVTRLRADSVRGAGSIWARNQRLAFAVSVDGIRDSLPVMTAVAQNPRNFNFGNVRSLPVDTATAQPRVAWDDVFRLLKTSSGFPVAFQPLELHYCSLSDDPLVCRDSSTAIAVDGGVFDNAPVALAYSLYFERDEPRVPTALYLSPERRRVWPDQRTRDVVGRSASLPLTATTGKRTPPPHGLEQLVQLAGEAISTARQYELQFAGRMLPAEMYRQSVDAQLETYARRIDSLRLAAAQGRDAQRARIEELLRVARECARTAGARGTAPDSVAADSTAGAPECTKVVVTLETALQEETRLAMQGSARGRAPAVPATSTRAADSAAHARSIEAINRQFRNTARWHPLAGDWLGGFGAFLGRPLREHDFYVGMYDALFLIAENLLCDEPRYALLQQQVAFEASPLKACVADELARLITDPPVELGEVAPRFMASLYRDEFGLPLSLPAAPDSSLVVVDAVRGALNTARMREDGRPYDRGNWFERFYLIGRCRQPNLTMGPFCNSAMVPFFEALSQREEAMRILRRWSDASACTATRFVVFRTDAWTRPDDCRAEAEFTRMITDPEGRLYMLSRDVLGRLEVVTPRKTTSRRIASALLFGHGSAADRHRRGWDMGASSIPSTLNGWQRALFYAIPSTWALTPNIAGWGELGWEVRRHVSDLPLAISMPVRLRPFSEVGVEETARRMHTLIVPGVRVEYKALWVNTRVGVGYDFWYRPHDDGRAYRGESVGVFLSFGNKTHFALSNVPRGLPGYRQITKTRPFDRPSVLSLGFADVNGFVYWAWRLIWG